MSSESSLPAGGVATALPGAAEERKATLARSTHPVAWLCGLALLVTLGLIVIDAAAAKSPLLPPQPKVAGWLSGVGSELTFEVFLIALLVFTCAYLGLVAYAGRVSPRVAIGLIALLNLIVFVGPVLISTDVFSYIAYARMAVMHGVDPYVHGPHAILHDPIYKYVGADWVRATTAYGPVYTILSFPIAPLGLVASVWGMKLEAVIASGAAIAFTWRSAKLRGANPARAALIVGANPLWLIYGLGGFHNDLVMIAFMMAAVALSLRESDFGAGATLLVGAFAKATAVVLLPFMIVGRRRWSTIGGAALAAVVCAAVGYVLFGVHGADLFSVLTRDSSYVSSDGFPTVFAHLLGKPGVYPIDHEILKALLACFLLYLLWRTWRGYDWVASAGWAMVAVALTSPWLLAWYTLWGLPLAVVSRDRRVLIVVIAIQLLFIVHQTSPLFSPVSS